MQASEQFVRGAPSAFSRDASTATRPPSFRRCKAHITEKPHHYYYSEKPNGADGEELKQDKTKQEKKAKDQQDGVSLNVESEEIRIARGNVDRPSARVADSASPVSPHALLVRPVHPALRFTQAQRMLSCPQGRNALLAHPARWRATLCVRLPVSSFIRKHGILPSPHAAPSDEATGRSPPAH